MPLYLVEDPHPTRKSNKFNGFRHCDGREKKFLIFQVTSKDDVIKGSYNL